MSTERVNDVIDGLSRLIMDAAEARQSERYHPRQNPDEMDAEIKHQSERVTALRKLREQFEDEMATPREPQF